MKLLLIIDPQVDFTCPEGALFVPGSEQNIRNISFLINRTEFDFIDITCDMHPVMHISHAAFYEPKPEPFSELRIVNNKIVDQNNKVYTTVYQDRNLNTINYIKKVNSFGRKHIIWPQHCIMTFRGSSINPILEKTLEDKSFSVICKGTNPEEEQFSPLFSENNQLFNSFLINDISDVDEIYICGVAGSHCVRRTVEDIELCGLIKKVIWLEDCISPVPGFEHLQQKCIDKYTKLGMKVMKSTEISCRS